jgi:membrane protein YqaA with SNARE-associated domain
MYRYHRYLRKAGFYRLMFRTLGQMLLVVGGIVAILLLAQNVINDFDEMIKAYLQELRPAFVLSLFFASETFLGLIPPDFFIVWAGTFKMRFGLVTVLAILSYLAGLLAHRIGIKLGQIPRINRFLEKKFAGHYEEIRKYGGIFIVLAALFPLPYSTVCMAAGTIKYPVDRLALWGLTRLARYYVYAFFLFKLVEF